MAGISVHELERAKKLHLYRNGDLNFTGKDFIVNRRRIRTWDALLQAITTELKCPEAVRSLRTPVGGTTVHDFDELQQQTDYVVVGAGKFKKAGYQKIGEVLAGKKLLTPRANTDVKPVEHSRIQVSGRIRKIPTDVLTIFVYANGNYLAGPKRVTLTRRMVTKWEAIFEQVMEKVTLTSGAVRKLYTLEGQLVTDPASLQSMGQYVAVGSEMGGFKKMEYGMARPAFNSSPKRERNSWSSEFWKFTPLPPIRSKKGSSHPSSQASEQTTGTLDSSLNSTGSSGRNNRTRARVAAKPKTRNDKPKQQLTSNLPPATEKTPEKQRERPKKKEEDSVFHARPVKHKRSSDRPREVNYDKDEGGIFKAKDDNQETQGATEVEEGAETKVDLPIDQVEAEEVKEDSMPSIIHTDNDLTKPRPSDEDMDGNAFPSSTPIQEEAIDSSEKDVQEKPNTNNSNNEQIAREPVAREPSPRQKSPRAPTPQRVPSAASQKSIPREPSPKRPTPSPRKSPAPKSPEPSRTPEPANQEAPQDELSNEEPAPAEQIADDQNDERDQTDKEEKAAVKIQASFRGHKARQEVREMKKSKQEELQESAGQDAQS